MMGKVRVPLSTAVVSEGYFAGTAAAKEALPHHTTPEPLQPSTGFAYKAGQGRGPGNATGLDWAREGGMGRAGFSSSDSTGAELDGVNDQTISLSEAPGDASRVIRELGSWMRRGHVLECVHEYHTWDEGAMGMRVQDGPRLMTSPRHLLIFVLCITCKSSRPPDGTETEGVRWPCGGFCHRHTAAPRRGSCGWPAP